MPVLFYALMINDNMAHDTASQETTAAGFIARHNAKNVDLATRRAVLSRFLGISLTLWLALEKTSLAPAMAF
jgi:hypothetical protein